MGIFNSFFNKIDTILFPEKCICCKKIGDILCFTCIKQIPRPERDLPEYIYAVFEYRNQFVKKLLTDAKYRKRFSGLKVFGNVLHDTLQEIINEYSELTNYSRIIVIPVPISNKRYKKRGFNQTEILVNEIFLNIKDKNVIKENNLVLKVKDKTPQASIKNRSQRLKSPIGTFELNKNKIELLQNSLCIIVDDITTTGGTISEVRRILIKSGAQDAIGLAVAH